MAEIETGLPFTIKRSQVEVSPAKEEEDQSAPFTIKRSELTTPKTTEEPSLKYYPSLTARLRDTKMVSTDKGVLNLDSIKQEYGRPFIKEDFLKDDRLQELMIQNLEARFSGDKPTVLGKARKAATATAGGFTTFGTNFREMEPEDLFERWQNYQRSFGVGQSVTLANEIAYTISTDDKDKVSKLGLGYLLFDSMDNAITGEGSWGELGDAVWDYSRGVIYDPATLATFGISKALQVGTGKLSNAAARNVAIRTYKRGLEKSSAGRLTKNAVGKLYAAAPYMAPDLAFNAGADIAQQLQLIRTDAQEEYDAKQTGLVAFGTMALPVLFAGMKGFGKLRKTVFKDTPLGAPDLAFLEKELAPEIAWGMVLNRFDNSTLIDSVSQQFGRLKGNTEELLKWSEAKEEAAGRLGQQGMPQENVDVMNMFEDFFWFGEKDGTEGGFAKALIDAGFIAHPSMAKDQTISSIYGQAIKYILDDEVVAKIVKDFEDASGRKLDLRPTAEGLSDYFVNRSKALGQGLAIRSNISRLNKAGLTGGEMARAAAGNGVTDASPERLKFAVSVYKRLLTSHLSTTGANLKGFAQLVSIDTLADAFSTTTYLTQGSISKALGKNDSAEMFFNKAKAAGIAPFRRVTGVLTPDLDIEYATKVLEANPEQLEKLFREIAGDSGPNQALERFNLDPENKLNKAVDGITRGAQTLAMVQLQDDITKRWAFAANLDREIMRQYGTTAEKFWAREDSAVEMKSDKFQELLDRTVYRTQRQTASVNWSTLPGKKGMRSVAKVFEGLTNRQFGGAGGFVIPFASFMNTTVATLGDLSGVNAMTRIVESVYGRKLDYADQDFGELIGKAAAGWTLVGAGIPAAVERIQQGYSWDQEPTEFGGEVQSKTFDWPESTLRLTQQIIGHMLVGKEIPTDPVELGKAILNGDVTFDISQVPADLLAEFGLQAGPGQALRDIDDTLLQIKNGISAAFEGDVELGDLRTVLGTVLSKPISGATRPLDIPNQVVGFLRDGNMNPDLRQGPKHLNEMLRYTNQLFPESIYSTKDMERRATPLRGTDKQVDAGKPLFGNRMSREPNLAEAMFNSAGIPSWKAARWGGTAEVKNTMDSIASTFFEQEALNTLQKYPDFFDLTTKQRQVHVNNMKDSVGKKVRNFMENSGKKNKTLDVVRRLDKFGDAKVGEVINFLGYEGNLSDILEQEDAFEKLNMIEFILKDYDLIMLGINE